MRGRPMVLVGALTVAVLIGAFVWPGSAQRTACADQSGQVETAREQLKHARALSAAFEEVAEAVKPSVVSITSIKRVETPALIFPGPRGPLRDPLREFFGDDLFERFFGRGQPEREGVVRGGGTGVIVSADGYVLTNNHVVEGADQVTVSLADGRRFVAQIVGTDPKTDLAVIKISADGLKPAQLGDSERLRVGEWVLAVGNPLGLEQTVTAGIISAKGRSYVGLAEYEDYIQTDAAINPGNSGGPLLNLDGQVVGINSAIVSRSGGYMGIGFAIPANMARKVMEDIIADGKVTRGYLGVIVQNLTPDLARSFGYDQPHGVLVAEVAPDGPAAKAGIESDDIIIELGGKPMDNMNELRNAVATTDPGTKVEVKVFRKGQTRSLKVEIGELDSAPVSRAAGRTTDDLGLAVENLTAEEARRLGLSDAAGVLVTEVEPGGVAERSGLLRYDVIISVGDKPVRNVRDFHAALREHDLDRGVRIKVRTQDASRYVFLKR